MLIYFLGGQWNLLPVAGRIEYGIDIKPITNLYLVDSVLTGNLEGFWSTIKHLLMPAITLGTALAAIVTRITRSSVLEVMRQEYVMTARAKGLSESVVIWRHILRNALITVITILGLQLGALLNGSVIGDECIIGAGSIVTEGGVIPPRSLVLGSPGKVVRSITEDELKRIQNGAANYRGYAQRQLPVLC